MFTTSQGTSAVGRRSERKVKRGAKAGFEALESRALQAGGLAAAAAVVSQVPVLAHPIIVKLPPPAPLPVLDLTGLNVQPLGNNQFKVTATLRDGLPRVILHAPAVAGSTVASPVFGTGPAYPGGGVLEITRSTGGTTLNSQSPYNPLATPAPSQVIASMPIPHLNFGQSIQVSAVTTGRAVFTGTVAPLFNPVNNTLLLLPRFNGANDTRTVSNLVPHSYDINTFSLGLIPGLGSALQNSQIRLDSSDSYVSIPGVVNQHFTIPPKTVSIGVSIFSVSAKYYVDNLTTTSVALSYEQGGLALTVKFADNQHALHTTSSIFPDISVTNLQVKILLPLTYNAASQAFTFGTPQVTVTGNWHANGLLGSLFDLLIPDLNAKASAALQSALAPELGLLAYQLNNQVHNFITGGRIDSATVEPNDLILSVETPN